MEVDLTGVDPLTHPEMATWEWHIAVYLFIGGLVAGVMVIGAIVRMRRASGYDRALRITETASLPLLVVGLLLLFADLGNGWNSWRFYTTFQPTSAMSWGAWILVVAMVVLTLRVAVHSRSVEWEPHGWRGRLATVARRVGSAVDGRLLDIATLVVGVALGVYTGVLLSTIPARPLWDTQVLPLLFLVSGIAVGGAFLCVFLERSAHLRLIPWVLSLCGVELVLLGVMIWTLRAGSPATDAAAGILTTGAFAPEFWGGVVVLGLVVPAVIEALEWARRRVPDLASRAAPYLKLGGGVALRFVIVYAGLSSAI